VLYHKQWKALIHAKSITGRIFAKADQCPYHIGIGNIGLTIDVMVEWLDEKTGEQRKASP